MLVGVFKNNPPVWMFVKGYANEVSVTTVSDWAKTCTL